MLKLNFIDFIYLIPDRICYFRSFKNHRIFIESSNKKQLYYNDKIKMCYIHLLSELI